MAKSLEVLRKQLNEMFPDRSKVSDGGIGDVAHQKAGTSDHLPHVKDKNNVGVVTARDFTFDNNPADGVGIDCHWLAKVLVKDKDPRIKYIIWNGQIISSKQQPWIWRKYSGKNPHKHHLHISVVADESLFNSEKEWNLGATPTVTGKPVTPPTVATNSVIGRGAKGEQVKLIQTKLVEKGFMKHHQIDSDFGILTESAVQRFQKSRNLIADGMVGDRTKKALGI